MSKINIQSTIDYITARTNIHTPLIEAIVNSIEAIDEANVIRGEITVLLRRENILNFDGLQQSVKDIEIQDNGIGFNQRHRDSFDTFYTAEKKKLGGKGFGRFMFLKYFNDVKIDSIYKDGDDYYRRKFTFGKDYDIIINEQNEKTDTKHQKTSVYLNNIKNHSCPK